LQDVLHHQTFSTYLRADNILSHLEHHEGIFVGGRNLNKLRYADDTTLMADSECKLQ